MKFNKVEIKLAVESDVMQDGVVCLPAASKFAICGDPVEVKKLVAIIQRARSGEADACIELLEYGKKNG